MVEYHPVQTSAVYVLGQNSFPAIPPPSPPSPITPTNESDLCNPIDDLCLGEPATPADAAFNARLSGAVHVLNTEATALAHLTTLYSTDPIARDGFHRAVAAITRQQRSAPGTDTLSGRGAGKLVVIGVGKSGHIAKKLVASFNSLGVHAQFLHPTEALHGDLGQIGPHDTFLVITFSGKTPELLLLLPHLDARCPLVLLTSHTRPETCELIRHRPEIILLPAPVHESETASFGVSAPTTSTTVALSIGDALAIVASQELHPSVSAVFAKNHPGGAIGAAFAKSPAPGSASASASSSSSSAVETASVMSPACSCSSTSSSPAKMSLSPVPSHKKDTATSTMRQLAIPLASLPCVPAASATGADVLRAAYAAPSGWVRVDMGGDAKAAVVLNPARIRALSSADLGKPLSELGWAVTNAHDAVSVADDTKVHDAVAWIRDMRSAAASAGGMGVEEEEGCECGDDAVVAVLERGECVGVLEVGMLMQEE